MQQDTAQAEISSPEPAPPGPERLEEVDLLRLLVIYRDLDLYEAQQSILKLKVADAQRTLTALHAQLRDKYRLTSDDAIDVSTGVVVRHGAHDKVGG